MFMVITEKEFPKLTFNVYAIPIQKAGITAQFFFWVKSTTVGVNFI